MFEQAPYQRAIIRLASQEVTHLSRSARAEFGRLYHAKFIGQVEGILQAGVGAGELRAMDASLAAWLLLGMMYPFLYPIHEREPGLAQAAIDLLVSVFFEGAAARAYFGLGE